MVPPLAETPALVELFELARRVAKSPDTPVLILGERGTGIDDLARFIHDETPSHRGHAFTSVRCDGAGDEQLERILIGLGRATAGAKAKDDGRPGTLFLDDVGALGAVAQEHLARFLDEERAGARRSPSRGCVRVIVGAREPIAALVEHGRFRDDLRETFSVVRCRIPPLRERPDDIVSTAELLVRDRAALMGKAVRGISAPAARKLRGHRFPGNLRELEAVVERAVIYEASDVLGPDSVVFFDDPEPGFLTSFSDTLLRSLGKASEPPSLAQLERAYITWLLARTNGNRTAAARILRVSYPTIAKKIADYKIEAPKLGAAVK
jgi:NtrC-family two-component system response regulator AlgB